MSGAQTFGPFELVRRLGVGGMAETFLAVRRGPGGFEQRVCLKRILPALEGDAQFVKLFLAEARIAARLRHANIVQVLGFDVAEGSHYLVLELIEGVDLRGLLRSLAHDARLPAMLVAYVAQELAVALDAAHRASVDGAPAPVIHRDVSPSNVLLSEAGEVKLSDFGIAKALRGDGTPTHITQTSIKGKVPYMAPEYATKGVFDARSDLFALGVVLYELMAGRRPHVGTSDSDTVQRAADGEHDALQPLAPDAPRALVDAVEKLLAPDPDARFQSAAELLDALAAVSPPPSSRRALGELVVAARRRSAPLAGAIDPALAVTVLVDAAERTEALDAAEALDGAPAIGPADTTRTADPPDATTRRGRRLPAASPLSAAETLAPYAPTEGPTDGLTQPLAPRAAAPRKPTPGARAALFGMYGVVALVALVSGGIALSAGGPWLGDDTPTTLTASRGVPVRGGAWAADAGTQRDARVSLPDAAHAADAGARVAEATPAASERASIEVVIFPRGDVWLDGVRAGPSPYTGAVRPGRHVVAAGSEQGALRRVIDVEPGEQVRVILR